MGHATFVNWVIDTRELLNLVFGDVVEMRYSLKIHVFVIKAISELMEFVELVQLGRLLTLILGNVNSELSVE